MRVWVFLFYLLFTSITQCEEIKPSLLSEFDYGNLALAEWLSTIERDEQFLLLDRESRTLSLMYGGAVLRICDVVEDALTQYPTVKSVLDFHLRRFRPLESGALMELGPFYWEERLIKDTSSKAALYFSGGVFICSDKFWMRKGTNAIKLLKKDFQVLFNACLPGTILVILPKKWRGDNIRIPFDG